MITPNKLADLILDLAEDALLHGRALDKGQLANLIAEQCTTTLDGPITGAQVGIDLASEPDRSVAAYIGADGKMHDIVELGGISTVPAEDASDDLVFRTNGTEIARIPARGPLGPCDCTEHRHRFDAEKQAYICSNCGAASDAPLLQPPRPGFVAPQPPERNS